MYRVSPKRGDAFVVNESHILSLQATNEGKSHRSSSVKGGEIDNISIRDYLAKSKTWKHLRKLRRVAVDFPTRPAPRIGGWYMGIILGDGSTIHGVAVTKADREVLDGMELLASDWGLRTRRADHDESGYTETIHLCRQNGTAKTNPLFSYLVELGVAGCRSEEKFIPDEFKFGSRAVRLGVLAGLMDSDGHLSSGVFDFISKSERLSRDVAFIARSLGLSANIQSCQKRDQNGQGGTYWRVCVSGDVDLVPTCVPRKQASPRRQKKNPLVTGFDLEPVGVDDFFGFELDGDHLYLTADFVVHHNTGKSVVIAGFVKGILDSWPSQRILVVTHVRELVEQNAKALLRLWPEAPVGVYSAGLKRRDYDRQITFAGIQSIHKKAGDLGWFDLVLIDECHLLPKSGTGMYRTYLQALQSMNPAAKVIGFTATPYRTDSGLLYEGDERLFEGVAYNTDMVRLIKAGYLSPLVPKRVEGEIDTQGIRKQAGDFAPGELEKAAMAGDLVTLACAEIMKWGADRRSWLLFGCGVTHAKKVEETLRDRGITIASVFGDTPLAERAELIAKYRAGELRALVNVGVLTTGFDAPQTDLIAMLRPTCSPGLYVQQCGRGMRIADGKANCLVLDFGGNVDRHGPVDMVKPKKKGEGGGPAPTKTCPSCKTIVFAGLRECPECGFAFPAAGPQHDVVAHTREIIAGLGDTQKVVNVAETVFGKHQKSAADARPTLRVEYQSDRQGLFAIREWIALEHSGYARTVAESWWLRRGKPPVPQTIDEALRRTGELRQVASLKVDTSGKHPRILGYAFRKPEASHDQPGEDRVPGLVPEAARGDPG